MLMYVYLDFLFPNDKICIWAPGSDDNTGQNKMAVFSSGTETFSSCYI